MLHPFPGVMNFGMNSIISALDSLGIRLLDVILMQPVTPLKKSSSGRHTRTMREFGSLVNSFGLHDSPLLNEQYTWTNGRQNLILCHFDWFFISSDWEDNFSHFYQEAHSRLVSNHWPIMLSKDSFSVPNLFTLKTCGLFIPHSKQTRSLGGMIVWHRRMKDSSSFGNFNLSRESSYLRTKLLMGCYHLIRTKYGTRSLRLIYNIRTIKAFPWIFSLEERLLWWNWNLLWAMKKSIGNKKIQYKWIKKSDGNSKFFHRVANWRKRKNLVTKLIIDGKWDHKLWINCF